MGTHSTLPFDFICPEIVRVGRTVLRTLIEAVTLDDSVALAAMRTEFAGDASGFDRFVSRVRALAAGDYAAASSELARVESASWQVSASILRAIAVAAGGNLRRAIVIANQARDHIEISKMQGAASYPGDRALFSAGIRCLLTGEAALPLSPAPLQIAKPFSYVISYPRSGSTLLTQFLSFAFAAPRYSVYPGDGRYFSRRLHERTPGHAVFVKEHSWHEEYLGDPILFVVRDGRNAVVSFARFLYAEGSNRFVRRGELADFLSWVATRTPFGFWGDHTRSLLEARDRNARVRLVRYEEIFCGYARLSAVARELADGSPLPCNDEKKYAAFAENAKRMSAKSWSESLALPEDSFIPQDWSVGGGTINWRRAFDAPARRRFHELGGTEMLIRLGYESNADWWRD